MGWNFRKKKNIPGGLWLKCPDCGTMLQRKKMDENLSVCTDCDHHFRVTARQRIDHLLDKDSFEAAGEDLKTTDVLKFDGYDSTLERSRKRSGLSARS